MPTSFKCVTLMRESFTLETRSYFLSSQGRLAWASRRRPDSQSRTFSHNSLQSRTRHRPFRPVAAPAQHATMSRHWWNNSQTTVGHGVFSQYKPDHLKEWVAKETRKQERSTSPQKSFTEGNSFLRSSLFAPIDSAPIENRHHASTRTLQELRQLQSPPSAGTHTTTRASSPSKLTQQPLEGSKYLPHLSHHHHFGWNPPTPQARIAVLEPSGASKGSHNKYGIAQAYNQQVFSKSSVITTRKA